MIDVKLKNHETIIKGKEMYLIGGYYNKTTLNDTKVISISGEQIERTSLFPPMFYKRKNFGMCSFSDCIFIAGGEQQFNEEFKVLDKCEFYSFKSNKWHEIASMNTKRCTFSIVYFQKKVWAIGGFDDTKKSPTNVIETFDLTKNRWTVSDVKLVNKRYGHSTVAHDNKLYVVGGNDFRGILASVEVYSGETNQFSYVTSMRMPRTMSKCCIINSSLYVIGGSLHHFEEKPTKTVEIYEIEKGVWTEGPSLPFGLTNFGCSKYLPE